MTEARARSLVSIVIPARNEEGNIARVEREILAAVDGLPYDFEFILIDNDSSDSTPQLCRRLCERDSRWKYVRLSRNFGVDHSITAAYHFARGDAVIVIYSDLQDPPEMIPTMLAKWREGYDVVYGVRTVREGDPRWRNFAVKTAYRLISMLADAPIPTDAGDFRLISRRVRDALEECGESNRYLRGLIAWMGFRQTGVHYERRPRIAGVSKAPFTELLFFVFNAVTSFSLKPLRLFTFLGLFLLAVSGIAAIVYTALWVVGTPPPGVTTLIILSFLSIGLNSFGIGVLGEYLGRTYIETKRRPLYLVAETVNVGPPGAGD
jgi:polyisoprenyl-phosphate glycosyltransferase